MVRIELEKAGIANRIPSGVIITGGGAETVGVADAAKRMLSLPVRIGRPRGVGGLIDDIMVPAFATPVGLILHGASFQAPTEEGGISRNIKRTSQGIAGRLIESIKNLLP
jgi:cell division protein FtsA